MFDVEIFKKLGELVSKARRRDIERYSQFLDLYEQIVRSMPSDAVKEFGTLPVVALDGGKTRENWGLMLTVTDFCWWKKNIEELGTRFADGPARVELDMFARLSKKAESLNLTSDERSSLMELLKPRSSDIEG